MGCSGSRTLDSTGKPIIRLNCSKERIKSLERYNIIMSKINEMAKSNENILLSTPLDKDDIPDYYELNKEHMNKFNLNLEEFSSGSKWYHISSDFNLQKLNMLEIFPDAFKSLYRSDDYDKKIKLKEKFSHTLSISKGFIYNQKTFFFQINERNHESALQFLMYDSKVDDLEALAIIITMDFVNNKKLIQDISEALLYMKNICSFAVVIDPDSNVKEYNIDHFIPIFDSLAYNIRISSFLIISPCAELNLSGKNHEIILNVLKRNDCLVMLGLSKINFSEANYETLLKYAGNHKSLKGLGIDIKGEFNENLFKKFVECIKISKNLNIGCFYNGNDSEKTDKLQLTVDELGDKFISVSPSLEK